MERPYHECKKANNTPSGRCYATFRFLGFSFCLRCQRVTLGSGLSALARTARATFSLTKRVMAAVICLANGSLRLAQDALSAG